MKDRRQVALLTLVVAAVAAARLWRIAGDCLDGDEIFSIMAVRYGWDHTADELIRDAIHPPLFYLLLRGWVALGGEQLFWIRLFPALTSIVAAAPLWLLCRELRLTPAARLSVLALYAVNPFLVFHGQHVRMYSLLLLLSVTSMWLFVRLLREGSERAVAWGLFWTNLALVYTQYYGWTIVLLELLIVAGWRRPLLVRATRQLAALGLLFAPWAYLAGRSIARKGGTALNLGWIELPGLDDLLWFFVEAAGATHLPVAGTAAVLVALAATAVLLARRLRGPRTWDSAGRYFLAAAFAFVPVLLAVVASYLLPHPVWGYRHLIVSVPPLLLLAGLALDAALSRPAKLAAAITLGGWVVLCTAQLTGGEARKVAWDTLVLELLERQEQATRKVPLYAVRGSLHYTFWFFLEEWKSRHTGLLSANVWPKSPPTHLAAVAANFEVWPVDNLDSIAPGRSWIASSSSSWPPGPSPEEVIRARGCHVGEAFEASDPYQTVRVFPADCPAR